MANELNFGPTATGMTGATALTAQLYTAGASSGSPIAMTEVGTTGIYTGTMAGSAGTFEIAFLQAGTTTITMGVGHIIWDGSAEVTANTANVTKVNGTAQTARDLGQGIPNAVPGAAGGLFIAGSNAATTTASLNTGAITAGTITQTGAVSLGATTIASMAVTGALSVGTTTTLTGAVSAPAGITANITGNLVGTVSTLTTYTGNTPQTGDSFARIGAAGVGLTAITDAIAALPTATENADTLLNRDMGAVSDTNARSPLNALRLLRNKWDIAAGVLTVKEEDDTTSAWTATLSTDAAGVPIIGQDPA
jgi:fibronectin-binding autotransporter adhesin